MMRKKLDFETAFRRIGKGLPVYTRECRTTTLDRKIWVAEWHIPLGPSNDRVVTMTKDVAIDAAIALTIKAHAPNVYGMRAALRYKGFFQFDDVKLGEVITTIKRERLGRVTLDS